MSHSTFISDALGRVAPSATLAVTQKARDMRQAGIDVIALGSGEPDFDTPEHIKLAAMDALAHGQTKYTAVDGIPELKKAICQKFKSDNHLDYAPDQINVSPGGKAVIFNALLATLNPGDEVIIPTPCWVSYPEIVKFAGAAPKFISCDQNSGFKLTPEKLDAAITPQTKWLILNSPSNPTGAAYSQTELEALGDALLRHAHVLILTDDIYEHLIYDNFEFVTLAQAVPALYDRVITMNGVSKAYAMTGWRIGFAGGPSWLIKAMAKIMSQSTTNPSSISQYAALAALSGSKEFMHSHNQAFTERRNMVVSILNATTGLSCLLPNGAFYAYPDCSELLNQQSPAGRYIQTDIDLTQALLEEAHVAVVPGSAFYGSPNFRLSYATDMESLKEACSRIQNFCHALKPL